MNNAGPIMNSSALMKNASQPSTSAKNVLPKPRDTARTALAAARRVRKKLAAHGISSGDSFAHMMVDLLVLCAERRNLDPALLFENTAPAILAALRGLVPARKRGAVRKTSTVPHLPTVPLSELESTLMQEAARLGLGPGLNEIAAIWILVAALAIESGRPKAQTSCTSIAARLRSEARRATFCQVA